LRQPIGNSQTDSLRSLQSEAIAATLTNSPRMWRRRGGWGNANRIYKSTSPLSIKNDSLDSRPCSASTGSSKKFETDCEPTRGRGAKAREIVTVASTTESSHGEKKRRYNADIPQLPDE
jgi:hypothetical protein